MVLIVWTNRHISAKIREGLRIPYKAEGESESKDSKTR